LVAIAQWMMNDLARATFVKERELCHDGQPWPQGAHLDRQPLARGRR